MKKQASERDCSSALATADPVITVRGLSVHAGSATLLRNVGFDIQPRQVFGIIGPSGAGKSTLLRALNRLTDLIPGLRVDGDIRLQGESIYSAKSDVNALRARVGMLFQQPSVFPVSIQANVLFGAKRLRSLKIAEQHALAEKALREAALWDEVKDRLRAPAHSLSVGPAATPLPRPNPRRPAGSHLDG
jgi:phosphate transport system ATP-binding protein